MHPYLSRLGVSPGTQKFFLGSFYSDEKGNMRFPYGNVNEMFGLGFHKVPLTGTLWMAGELAINMVTNVIIFGSAMEAIAFYECHNTIYNQQENLLFLSTGTRPVSKQITWIRENLLHARITLVYSKDLLGKVCDLKLATGIRKVPVAIKVNTDQSITVTFKFRNYHFTEEEFSLSAFERASGFHTNCRTEKAKSGMTFLQQLTSNLNQNS